VSEGQVNESQRVKGKGLHKRPVGIPGTERILAFSDGVFAIVITLLVFEIKVPDVDSTHVAADLPAALVSMIPWVESYVLAFALLGIYWIGHHAVFRFIKRYDRNFLWINLLFLMFVAFMPLPTTLLIRYGNQEVSIALLCVVLILTGLSAALLWWYASKDHRLLDERVPADVIGLTYRRILIAPAIYVLALAVSFVSMSASKLILVGVVLIYLVPNPLTMLHVQHHQDLDPSKPLIPENRGD
jgi:uncharacterized membrane protein